LRPLFATNVGRALTIASFALVGVFFAANLRAQAATSKGGLPTRVAIVNLAKVMDGLAEGKDAKMRLDASAADFKQQLSDISSQLKKVSDDLELKKDQKDTPEYRKLVGQRLELLATGRAREAILQQLVDEQEGSTIRSMYLRMTDAIQKIAIRDGWDLVLKDDRDIVPPERLKDNNGVERPITGGEVRRIVDQRQIMAANPAVDISQVVVDQMNNDYKGAKH
jgi:Skp family chaperone for outer membrane proteins